MTIDYSKFPIAKPGRPPRRRRASSRRREREIRDRHAAQAAVIRVVRPEVFRADPVCVVCLGPARDTDEMNEVVPRSKTRGLPPDQRFHRKNCVRVHRACHRLVTEHRVDLAFLDPEQGVDGGLVVQRREWREAREAVVYWRKGRWNRAVGQWVPVQGHGFRGLIVKGVWCPES